MAPSHKYEDLHLDIYDNSRKYDDLLDGGHDDVSVILKCPPRRVSTYVCALVTPFIGRIHIQDAMFIRSHRKKWSPCGR